MRLQSLGQSLGPEWSLLLQRGIRRGLLTVLRERGWWTALGALLGTVFLVQILLLVFLGVVGIQRMLHSQTDLRLEVLEHARNADVQEFFSAIRDLPYVEEIVYITKEQAYELERQRDPELIAFLEEFELKNPFPDTIGVTLRSLEDYDPFAAFVRRKAWSSIVDPAFLSEVTDQEEQVYELSRLTRAGRSIVFLFLLLMTVVVLFVLMELTRRRAGERREEVLIERLVGAPLPSILIPFAVESAVLLLCAILLSVVFLLLFLWIVPMVVPALGVGGIAVGLRQEAASLLRQNLPLFLLLELLLTPVLAFGGAWFGMWPSVRSTRLSVSSP